MQRNPWHNDDESQRAMVAAKLATLDACPADSPQI
jgi:hypothetical protein